MTDEKWDLLEENLKLETWALTRASLSKGFGSLFLLSLCCRGIGFKGELLLGDPSLVLWQRLKASPNPLSGLLFWNLEDVLCFVEAKTGPCSYNTACPPAHCSCIWEDQHQLFCLSWKKKKFQVPFILNISGRFSSQKYKGDIDFRRDVLFSLFFSYVFFSLLLCLTVINTQTERKKCKAEF